MSVPCVRCVRVCRIRVINICTLVAIFPHLRFDEIGVLEVGNLQLLLHLCVVVCRRNSRYPPGNRILVFDHCPVVSDAVRGRGDERVDVVGDASELVNGSSSAVLVDIVCDGFKLHPVLACHAPIERIDSGLFYENLVDTSILI